MWTVRQAAMLLATFMMAMWVLEVASEQSGTRYGFIRQMDEPPAEAAGEAVPRAGGERRMFGGAPAELSQWSAACALLDRYWAPRCSATIVAKNWAVTAAHCISANLAYVKYNARHPSGSEGNHAPVLYLYRHPGFKVVTEDQGRGPDVVVLQHDVGLVRTRSDMELLTKPVPDPLLAMRLYTEGELQGAKVEVLGFGRTERSAQGEELYAAQLVMVDCERQSWMNCVCARGGEGASRQSDGEAKGVCVGDSGGPVLLNGALVAVTSMGPVECRKPSEGPPESATSVFTALRHYADLLNETIYDTDASLHMQVFNQAGALPSSAWGQLAFTYLYLLLKLISF